MKQEITVPSLGESITQGVLVQWLKHEGDFVTTGEDLFELETDKATLAVPSPHQGRLSILVAEGSEVSVGQLVGHIDTSTENSVGGPGGTGESGTSSPSERLAAAEKPSAARAVASQPHYGDGGNIGDNAGTQHLSPAVRKLIADHELHAAEIQGSGKDARITKADVVAHIESKKQREHEEKQRGGTPVGPASPPADRLPRVDTTGSQAIPVDKSIGNRQERRVKMPTIRRRIAERLVQAQHESAFLTTFNEVSMARIMALREHYNDDFQKKHGVKLGFMSFFVKASCAALKDWPSVNAMVDGEDFVYHDYYDIGIAVSTERGLVVPVLRDADTLSFHRIEGNIADFALRARTKRLTLDELSGGTFSISNGGVFGSLMSTPIPNPPQTAILGLHTIQKRPVVEDDTIVIRPMMYLALSYDHRLIDGREAVSFLRQIKDAIENPERLLFEL